MPRATLVLEPDYESGKVHGVSVRDFLSWVDAQPREQGLAIDTETASLSWNAKVRLVQFGNSTEGFGVDVSSDAGREVVAEAVKRCLGPLYFYNSPFDIHRLHQLGLDPEYIWPRAVDVHVLAHIVNPDRLSFKLKDVSRVELGAESTEAKKRLDAMMAKHGWTWATCPLLVLTPYGVRDTTLTHGLAGKFLSQLSTVEWSVVEREMEVRWAMAVSAQWHGMRLDVPYALDLRAQWEAKLEDDERWFTQWPLEDIICTRCRGTGATPSGKRVCGLCKGERWLRDRHLENPNADAQIASALRVQGWEPAEFTEKAHKPKLDKSVLKPLTDSYPLVARLREYKRIGKWKAAYVDNCLEEVDENGYVHASYNTLGAKTGRMSCSQPPLQQLPKGGGGEVRRLFIASEGNVIASCDYSAIEPRLAGSLSGEPRIIRAYENDEDLYIQFGTDLGITRPEAKIFFLATLYGAQPPRHAEVFGWDINRSYRIVRDFWRAYPVLAKWNDHIIRSAREGVPIISGWGRTLRPHYPGAAPNAVIQGTAAEVLKDGLMRLWQQGLLQYVVAVVHDEVVLDVPADEAESIAAQVASVLEDRTFRIPLVAEASVYGRSWGDGYAEKAA